jgi:hypothetical protein
MNDIEYTDTKYPQNTKSKYDLVSRRLVMNGRPTNKQAISYKGNFINTFGLNYTIVAHEDLYRVASKAAGKLGLTSEHTKPDKKQKWWREADFGNAELSETGGQMIATFLDEGTGVDVTGEGDWVRAGVTIKGSIDGSSSTKIIPSTERKFCFNRMYHLVNVGEVENEAIRSLNAEIQKDEADLELMKLRWNHSKSFNLQDFAASFESAITKSRELLEKYQDFKNHKVTQAMAFDIHESLGKRFAKELDWLEVDGDDVKIENIDKWKAFNDITQKLTHGNVTKSMQSIMWKYREVDRIFMETPLVTA